MELEWGIEDPQWAKKSTPPVQGERGGLKNHSSCTVCALTMYGKSDHPLIKILLL